MSEVRTNSITDAAGTGAPDFPNGIEVATGQNIVIGTDSGDPFNANSRIRIQGAGDEWIQIKSDGTGAVGLLLGDTTDDFTAGIQSNQADGANLLFYANNTERMRIDASGNLGLGVTPSAWSTLYSQKAFQFGPVGSLMSLQASTTNNQTYVNSNAVNLSGGWTYMYSDSATQYRQFAGTHSWSNAPSGTAGNAITFTQAMTLDASGNLLVGKTTSTGSRFEVERTDNDNAIADFATNNGSGDVIIRSSGGYVRVRSTGTNEMAFLTAGTERFRVASAGQLGIGGANYGTSGQVLTSGGSGAAPSWASVGTAIAGLAYGAVGTYIYGSLLATNIADNGTYAGSSIVPAGILTPSGTQLTDASGVAAEMNGGGSALSGTWRAMGRSQRVNTTTRARISLFLRIS